MRARRLRPLSALALSRTGPRPSAGNHERASPLKLQLMRGPVPDLFQQDSVSKCTFLPVMMAAKCHPPPLFGARCSWQSTWGQGIKDGQSQGVPEGDPRRRGLQGYDRGRPCL